MIGNIKRPNPLKPFDPSSYFDPTTNTCTEADFIKILEKGVYDSSLVGKFVTLSNTVDYDGGKWVIADVDHDSENTGQTNCYDLISVDCFYNINYSVLSQSWSSSNVYTWLKRTFYPGFSADIKSHMMYIKYKSRDSWYEDSRVISPSYTELNGDVDNSYAVGNNDVEGIKYPIFNNGKSTRIKQSSGSNQIWWTRSRLTYNSTGIWCVAQDGSTYSYNYAGSYYTVALMRVQ